MAKGRKPAKIKGLSLVRSVWVARYTVDGKEVRKSFGSDKEAAIDALNKVRFMRRAGEHIPGTATVPLLTHAEKEKQVKSTPLLELCEDMRKWIVDHPTQYKDQINPPQRLDRIIAELGHIPAAALKPKDVEVWLDSLTNEHRGPDFGRPLADASVNRYRVTLSSVYKRAIKNEKATDNPVRNTSQRKVDNSIIRWLRPAEEQDIRLAIQARIDAEEEAGHLLLADQWRHHMCEFIISLQTGMRKGEQYGLVNEQVDLTHMQIHVRESKNGTERYIPMLPEVVTSFELLRQLGRARKARRIDEPNSSPQGVCFGLADNKKWWAAIREESGVKSYRWHDNRHTFCSRLAMAGKSIKIIQELAGHKDIKMSARYAHLDHQSKREALENAFLFTIQKVA